MKLIVQILLSCSIALSSGSAWAALTQTQVSQLYVSVFGRASEGEGNQYWRNDGNSIDMITTANRMLSTDAAKEYFGQTLNSNQDFIEHIYQNTLGKTYAEDPTGVDFWVSQLDKGKTKGEVVAAIIFAARDSATAGAAQDQFNNKVEISDYCADVIFQFTDFETFIGFIENVTNDKTTVASAKTSIDAYDNSDESGYTEAYSDTNFDAVDWTEQTHSKSAEPNFEEVFDDTQVKRIDFVVTAERWQCMLDDMTALYGEFGRSSGPGQAPGNGLIEDAEDPIFVPAEVFYNGLQWYRVGIRFKGNSSLQTSWEHGILKLPFKLDFDEFEDYYPQIDNQRFYGFKKFSLKNNYNDRSQLREKVAADVFADQGLAVSHTGFYALYVDHGEGPEYFGLYTLVEEVDGSVLDTQFTSDDGNLYKPEDGSADFVEGTFNTEDFVKKTNEDDEDWSDIEALFNALHATSRTLDPAIWRTALQETFDVDIFLHYLAVNGVIQNWDTYGRMPHNFYLYNDPDSSRLVWIPWDNNEALQDGKGALALDFSNLDADSWPLISKLYADETYKAIYDAYILDVIENSFETEGIQEQYQIYADLIEPYATTERQGYSFLNAPREFYQAITELKAHASDRADAVRAYLNN